MLRQVDQPPTVHEGLSAARRREFDEALAIAEKIGGNDAITIQNEVGRLMKQSRQTLLLRS
jgi:hypothetical protein